MHEAATDLIWQPMQREKIYVSKRVWVQLQGGCVGAKQSSLISQPNETACACLVLNINLRVWDLEVQLGVSKQHVEGWTNRGPRP